MIALDAFSQKYINAKKQIAIISAGQNLSVEAFR